MLCRRETPKYANGKRRFLKAGKGPLKVDGRRLLDSIEKLGKIGVNESGGIDRVCLTPNFDEGARFLVSLMEDAGLDVVIDQVGNIIGIANGASSLEPVVSGSHIDTVVNGGRLDGAYGVL
ncbi:MAG TPA: hypothetical protein VFE91_05845, partial [Nitrososphaerales archaeon]|nr:hypothetical protein [Nitrososphaerales archaeon]